MKKLLLFSFVLCMLFSCSKDDATILEKDNSVISDSKLSSRMSSNSENNFFELEFVEKALEIPNLPSASDLMIENVNYVRNNLTMARSIESNVINDKYPCWTCAIKDKIDGKDVLLTPIVNMATDEVSSIMLFTKYENTKNIFTLDVRALELHESISTPINSFSYYYGVKEYFEKVIHKTELDVDDFEEYMFPEQDHCHC